MFIWQNDLLGCIFGELTTIAGENTSSSSKYTFHYKLVNTVQVKQVIFIDSNFLICCLRIKRDKNLILFFHFMKNFAYVYNKNKYSNPCSTLSLFIML